jgi:multiple antibiotic resistance protein
MDFSVIDLELITKLLLVLLIGMGPKIALVPFLEKTKAFAPEQQRAIGRRMVITAVVAALVVFLTGALLLRLLHITSGAVAVAGGIILTLLAVKMALGSGDEVVERVAAVPADPDKLAVYPLAIPYLFNPVGITVLIIASESADSVAATGLVLGLVLLVGALDFLIFSNIDKIAKRINPTSLVVSEIVFGVLLTAVAVQLFVFGLRLLDILEPAAAAH